MFKGFCCCFFSIFFRSGGHFILQSGTILYILVISVKSLKKSGHLPWRRCRFKVFSGSGGHFVQRNRKVLEILVQGHTRNINVKLS